MFVSKIFLPITVKQFIIQFINIFVERCFFLKNINTVLQFPSRERNLIILLLSRNSQKVRAIIALNHTNSSDVSHRGLSAIITPPKSNEVAKRVISTGIFNRNVINIFDRVSFSRLTK